MLHGARCESDNQLTVAKARPLALCGSGARGSRPSERLWDRRSEIAICTSTLELVRLHIAMKTEGLFGSTIVEPNDHISLSHHGIRSQLQAERRRMASLTTFVMRLFGPLGRPLWKPAGKSVEIFRTFPHRITVWRLAVFVGVSNRPSIRRRVMAATSFMTAPGLAPDCRALRCRPRCRSGRLA